MSLSSFHIFLPFLDTIWANTEELCKGLWGQRRRGPGEVFFQCLSSRNAAHIVLCRSSSLKSWLLVRRQLTVKINLTHQWSMKVRKRKRVFFYKPELSDARRAEQHTVFMILSVPLENHPMAHPSSPSSRHSLSSQDALGAVSPGCNRTWCSKTQFHNPRDSFEDSLLCWGWGGDTSLPVQGLLGGYVIKLHVSRCVCPQIHRRSHQKKKSWNRF